jgi:hypothetical protein
MRLRWREAKMIALASQDVSKEVQNKVESVGMLLARMLRIQTELPTPRSAGETTMAPALGR